MYARCLEKIEDSDRQSQCTFCVNTGTAYPILFSLYSGKYSFLFLNNILIITAQISNNIPGSDANITWG